MTIHFVHKKAGCVSGTCAVVIGVLVEEGQPAAKTLRRSRFVPALSSAGVNRRTSIELEALLPGRLPQHAGYYTYIGSLTTPPCTEGINFIS
jgi:carbonic anhydrase